MWGLRRIAGLLLSGGLAAGMLLGTGGAAHAADVPWTFWQNYKSGQCLDIEGVSNFDSVGQSECHRIMGQAWEVKSLDGDRAFMLRSLGSGLCMGLLDFSSFNGAPVAQLPCNPSDQRVIWSDRVSNVRVVPGFSVPLMFVSTVGKCLDVENGQPARMPMQLWDCNANTGNQAWLGSI
jgi:hypothetical protein